MAAIRIAFAVRRAGTLLLLVILAFCGTGRAFAEAPAQEPQPAPYWSDAEKWVWTQLKAGNSANLNTLCRTEELAATDDNEKRWGDKCREISSRFLHDVLAGRTWHEAIPHAGVQIGGARIVGDLNLENAELVRAVWIYDSRVEGAITLRRARTKDMIGMGGTRVRGSFEADGMRSESSLFLRSGTALLSGGNLTGAKLDGDFDVSGTTVNGVLEGGALHVGGNAYLSSTKDYKSSFMGIVLRGADVAGQLDMRGVTVSGHLDCDALRVGTNLLMRSEGQDQASFKDVTLRGAMIGGQIDMRGVRVSGKLDGDALRLGTDLLMRSEGKDKASFKDITLRGATISGQISMVGATVDGTLDGDSMQVGRDVFMRTDDENRATFNVVNMFFAHIGSGLDLRGAKIASLDLSGTTAAGDFHLGTSFGEFTEWEGAGKAASLILTNAHLGSLVDDIAGTKNAWPAPGKLKLDGFSFSRLGGFQGQTGPQMRDRGAQWWDNWARLDTEYSPTPYAQLATAFAAMGDRDAANDIRFLGRVREREAATSPWTWLSAAALEYVAGFGIGNYTFRVVYWVLAFSLIGAAVLWLFVPAARADHRGKLWCFGASLSRLLPIIEINKEFTSFFDDPDRTRLNGWQTFFFSALGVVGWVLGAILIAAVSGLTQAV